MSNYLILATLLLMLGKLAPAAEDLTDRLKDRNELFLSTQSIRPYLFDSTVQERLHTWLTHEKNASYVVECQFKLRPFIRSEKILGALCYFLRQDNLEKRADFFGFVKRYLLEIKLALKEIASDPRYSEGAQNKAKDYLSGFKPGDEITVKSCFAPAMTVKYPSDGSFPFSPFQGVAECLRSSPFKRLGEPAQPYFAVNLAKEFPNHPGHTVSETGWIGGNRVEYLTTNDTSEELGHTLQNKFPLMEKLYPLTGRGSFESFRKLDPREVFTSAEGFYNFETDDPIWNQRAGIFREIRKSIDAAKESLFIDIFFLGGTMGASLAKHIVGELQRKPGLKVLILRDNHNHYGHEAEMRPIFNFLQAYSYNNPDRLVITGAHIQSHRSGLPHFMERFVTDKFLETSGIQEHLQLYGRAVSDHSKVIVVDGKSDAPVAFVGSKNWTDSSGGICYDEVVKVTGPGAAIVLDDYYYDMAFALKKELPLSFLTHLASRGWSATQYRPNQSPDEMVANILQPFDLLRRDAKGLATLATPVSVPEAGRVKLRTGMNNVDSTRTNVVDEVLQLILFAKKNIFIKDQFLFDRNVILALLKAKKARPGLDIRVILEPLEVAPIKGLPNLLYLDILTEAGIQVKWKHVIHAEKIAQEYHMKTISADGQNVIAGSANKDQTTMYGSFREEQVDVFDPEAANVHDASFIRQWESVGETSETFTHFDFTPPNGLKGFDGKALTAEQLIKLLRNVVAVLFDAST